MKNILIALFLLTMVSCTQKQNSIDNNLKKVKELPYQELIIQRIDFEGKKESPSRVAIVTEILITSPRYKQLTKVADDAVKNTEFQYFGVRIVGSPYPIIYKKWKYSPTFDFSLFEMYDDRMLITARFSFDPVEKQLYEFDEVNETLMPIKFDRSLLLFFYYPVMVHSIKNPE